MVLPAQSHASNVGLFISFCYASHFLSVRVLPCRFFVALRLTLARCFRANPTPSPSRAAPHPTSRPLPLSMRPPTSKNYQQVHLQVAEGAGEMPYRQDHGVRRRFLLNSCLMFFKFHENTHIFFPSWLVCIAPLAYRTASHGVHEGSNHPEVFSRKRYS